MRSDLHFFIILFSYYIFIMLSLNFFHYVVLVMSKKAAQWSGRSSDLQKTTGLSPTKHQSYSLIVHPKVNKVPNGDTLGINGADERNWPAFIPKTMAKDQGPLWQR